MNALVSTADVANAIDAPMPNMTLCAGPRATFETATQSTIAPAIAGPATTHRANGTRSRPPRGGTS